jgi:hypothetical protein
MMHRFYAVTLTSIYLVCDKDGRGRPYAEKIALRGESDVAVGRKLGQGTMLAICKFILLYVPESESVNSIKRGLEREDVRYWGDHSSPIVGLFKYKKDALRCFNHTDAIRCDSRWLDSTLSVLEEIGEEHPAFTICNHGDLAMFPSVAA